MPFTQNAKDNLAIALSLASFLTDEQQQYLPLSEQLTALRQILSYLALQKERPFMPGTPGRKMVLQSLEHYLKVQASVDLFMRYVPIPACQIKSQLAYLDANVQKLFYGCFKNKIFRLALFRPVPPDLSRVDAGLKAQAAELVLGYAQRQPDQDKSEWQVFKAEIDNDLAQLSADYKTVLADFHSQFIEFREGHLAFMENYFKRCLLLAQLEDWLQRLPYAKAKLVPLPENKMSEFCQRLEDLGRVHLESEVDTLALLLLDLQCYSISISQHRILAEKLILLKPKYDAYRFSQNHLSVEEQLSQFTAAWVKPKFEWIPREVSEEKKTEWEIMRTRQSARKNAEREKEQLNDAPMAAKNEQSLKRPSG